MMAQVLYVNDTDERMMYRGLGMAPKSYLVFDPRLSPPYQVLPLKSYPVRSVQVPESADDYDSLIRTMLGADNG